MEKLSELNPSWYRGVAEGAPSANLGPPNFENFDKIGRPISKSNVKIVKIERQISNWKSNLQNRTPNLQNRAQNLQNRTPN